LIAEHAFSIKRCGFPRIAQRLCLITREIELVAPAHISDETWRGVFEMNQWHVNRILCGEKDGTNPDWMLRRLQ
jgi:hypothetical protein